MKKPHDYRFEVYRNRSDWEKGKKPVNLPVCTHWYGIPEKRAEDIVFGIAIGLRAKYAHPFVVLYRVDEGKEILIRTQQ